MNIPVDETLPVSTFAQCFNSVTNAYKYYWFWAILDHVTLSTELFISYSELSRRMLALAWYPLDYYKLSFGPQDSFIRLVKRISALMTVDNRPGAAPLFQQMQKRLPLNDLQVMDAEITETLKRYVIYRFLSPFFPAELRGQKDAAKNKIIERLTAKSTIVPYKIEAEGIRLSEDWMPYFRRHQFMLLGFMKWQLLRFLQRNNPNVIGLVEKLEKPDRRDLAFAKRAWELYLGDNPFHCIYSGKIITLENYSLDHFLPWSFTAHDLLWNLVPTTKSINSIKGNKLPNLDKLLEPFCCVQYHFHRYHQQQGNKAVQSDYQYLAENLSKRTFIKKLSIELRNHHRVAESLGFASLLSF